MIIAASEAKRRRQAAIDATKRRATASVTLARPDAVESASALDNNNEKEQHDDDGNIVHAVKHLSLSASAAAAAADNGEVAVRASVPVAVGNRPRVFVDFGRLITSALNDVNLRYADVLQTCTPGEAWETVMDARYHQRKSNGDVVLSDVRSAAARVGHQRTFIQMRFHEVMWNVCAPIFYPSEWQTQREAIMQRNNWQNFPPLFAAIWPRRNGKTTACSDGACAIVLKTPAVDVVCFAPTLRQAKQIMDQCRHTMKNHPDFKDFIIIQDQAECIKIKGPDGTIRSLTALPSTHKVIMRGGGGEWRETKQCVCVCPLAVMFSQ